MKKIVLSLAGLLATAAFAPEASAIPAFARQTGMACKACHFQHFPLLNSFGRAFKASGFTMIGAQGKVEDEHLSIPNVLNISALATAGYDTVSKRGTAAGISDSNFLTPNGGGELSLFFGGHITENIGFLSELAFPDNAVGTTAAKLPMLWDVGNNTRVGLVVVANNAPAYSFELLNTGAASTHRLMGNVGTKAAVGAGGNAMSQGGNHISVTGAAPYLGTWDNGAGHGVSFVATGNMGFVNIGKYALGVNALPGGKVGTSSSAMNATYARGAYIFDAGGWDSAIGIQSFSGTDSNYNGVVAQQDAKATIVDGQMQGEAGGMPLGIIASYGTAPTSTKGNLYNPYAAVVGATSKHSFNIAGELGVIPHKATVQLAVRSAKDGSGSSNAAVGLGDSDNAVMLGGTYELAQNVELSLTLTSNSGSAWSNTTAGATPIGKTQSTLLLEALF